MKSHKAYSAFLRRATIDFGLQSSTDFSIIHDPELLKIYFTRLQKQPQFLMKPVKERADINAAFLVNIRECIAREGFSNSTVHNNKIALVIK